MTKTSISLFLLCSLALLQAAAAMPPAEEGAETDPQHWVGAQRRLRRMQLNDKYRPVWHLVIPEGRAVTFDPNGAIFKDGVYHLWYIYQAEAGHHWAHVSSLDLFHWRWHSNDLRHHPGDVETGIYSGNAFLAPDGKVVIAYHGKGSQGNCIAFSSDPELNVWTKAKANPTVPSGWDPHMWYENGKYYQISGGTPPTVFVSDAYDEKMKPIGKLMTHDMPDVDGFEDVSCPDFFQMGDKWVLACISHQRGARYYVGQWDGKQFTPESHHRMNWPGGPYHAPETLLDDRGRRILWAWILDKRRGTTSGFMAMPRVLTLDETKLALNIEPPEEIERLRYQPKSLSQFDVPAGETLCFPTIADNCAEFEITIDPGKTRRFGINVLCSKDGREKTPVRFDRNKNIVQIDLRKTSLDKTEYRAFIAHVEKLGNRPNPVMETQDAPFTLKENEKVHLRVFLDKTILEVFVNGRQCISQVVYPTLDDAIHVEAFAEDGPVTVESVRSWKLFPAMQW